jgi:hypothetical protein
MVAKGTYTELIGKPDLNELLSSLQSQINTNSEREAHIQTVEKLEQLLKSQANSVHGSIATMCDSILSLAQSQIIEPVW